MMCVYTNGKVSSMIRITGVKNIVFTIKGGYCRTEKSCKVLMTMKAAKMGWVGPGAGQEQTMSRPGAE